MSSTPDNATTHSSDQKAKSKAKRQDSTEIITPSKMSRAFQSTHERRYSFAFDGVWKAAVDDMFASHISRSSTPSSSSNSFFAGQTGSTNEGGNENEARHRSHRRWHTVTGTDIERGYAGRRLSANFAKENDRQGHSKIDRGHHPTASVTTVHARGVLSGFNGSSSSSDSHHIDEGSKENEYLSTHTAAESDRTEVIDRRTSRPPLQVINANPTTEIDEFQDAIEENLNEAPSGSRQIPFLAPQSQANESKRVDKPSANVEIARAPSAPTVFSRNFEYSETGVILALGNPGVTAPSQDAQYTLVKAGSNAPRVALRIKPLAEHITFWDAADGENLAIKGRLEVLDLLHESYYHRASIFVRSYVAPNIRGMEHAEEPDFALYYSDPPRRSGCNPNRITGGIPNWAKSALHDDNEGFSSNQNRKGAQQAPITTSEWSESTSPFVSLRVKHFSIPIPARLFQTRETRLFQIGAKASFLSRIERGRSQELQAPMVQVSVSHLLSAREFGIRNPNPTWHLA